MSNPDDRFPTSYQHVVVGDTHVGSKYGLAPDDFHYGTGGLETVLMLNPLQEESLRHWRSFWPKVWATGLPTVVTFVGDYIDGFHHDTSTTWTVDEQVMVRAAVVLFAEIVNHPNVLLVQAASGTDAHIGVDGKYDNQVFERLAEISGKVKSFGAEYTAMHIRSEIGGVLYDVAHQGPNPGRRPHLMGNQAREYARDIVEWDLKSHQRPPDVILRGHFHRKVKEFYTDTVAEHQGTWLVVNPAYQWATPFTKRIDSKRHLSDVGLTWLTVWKSQVVSIAFDTVTVEQAESYSV